VEEIGLPSGRTVLVQSDALRGTEYGGNKARKFDGILEQARRRGVTRLISIGAIGSHHVLATALFARSAGMAARCYVVPQPDVPSAHENVQHALAAGAELVPVSTHAEGAIRLLASARDRRALVVPVGGSSASGTEPYVQAALELAPWADRVRTLVVALGSGGTAVGLAVGAALSGAPWKVDAVLTSGPSVLVRSLVHGLIVRMLTRHRALHLWPDVMRRLRIVTSELGEGYALPTTASAVAREYASARGLALDPVYTAKAFAHVLALDAKGRRGLAYWHTASAVGLPEAGVPWDDVPRELRALFRAC
jgi:D-cysteine desulfhydrase